MEAFDSTSSFRNSDFDHMRELFSNALTKLLDTLSDSIGQQQVIDLDSLRHDLSEIFKGIYFKVLSDSQMNH